MPVIDKYNIPFPYPPYPLQEHAINELRSFLELESKKHENQVSDSNKENLTQSKDVGLSRKPKWKVAVLESPTGTGKSQILLNSVLSYFFELYCPENQSEHRNVIDSFASNVSNEYSCNRKCIEINNTQSKLEKENLMLVTPLAASTTTHREMTLEEAIMREREREKEEREKREMRRQIRKRKRAQLAECKRKESRRRQQQKETEHYQHIDKMNYDNNDNNDDVDDFLIAQDRDCDGGDTEQNVETKQHQVLSDKMQNTHSVLTRPISSSSETEYSNSDSEDDEREFLHQHKCKGTSTSLEETQEQDTFKPEHDDENNLEEEYEEQYEGRSDADLCDEMSLSRLVPLRKPKVYFASRTHTQLEQLFNDLQITDFAKQHIVRRKQSKERINDSKHGHNFCDDDNKCFVGKDKNTDQVNKVEETESTTRSKADVHYLEAIHVAGRQHLCINAAIRQRASNNSTLLNELCTEAMKYERSPEGRRARHVQNTEREQKNIIKPTYQPSHLSSSSSSTAPTTAAAAVVISPLSCTNQSTCNNLKPISGVNINSDVRRNFESEQITQLQEEEAQHISSPLEDVEDSGSVFWQEAHNNTHTSPKGCEFCALHRIRALVEYVRRQHRKGQFVSMQEMIKLGQELRACPYLATQVLIRGADVVFIPYSYLVDEEQRERLLGGCSTNPISVNEMRSLQTNLALETEALTQSLREDSIKNETMYENWKVQRNHFHRPSRYSYHNYSTTMNDNSIKNESCKNRSKPNTNEQNALIEENAVNAPASLHGDVVVIDEAHNIADYCRSVSTSQITTLHLMLVQTVLHKYERVYEKRLLSRNKQRIREMLALIDKLLQFAKNNETPSISSSSPLWSQREHTQEISYCKKSNVHVYEFNNWLFDAKIDYIDVYPFLSFLTNSMLLSKLRGFVGSTLRKEFDQLINYKLKERERNALQRLNERKKLKTKGVAKEYVVHDIASPFLENKFNKTNDNFYSTYVESELLIHELCTLHHDNLQEYINMCNCDAAGNDNYDKTENVNINALVSWHVQNVSRALQQFVHFLRWLYKSNSSTRVLVESSATESNTLSSVDIKLIQLEPGQHTLASLIHQASATILAGGTMEPLLLTVSPLLPELEWNTLPTTSQQKECPLLTSPILSTAHNVSVETTTHINNNEKVALNYVYLIKEGHIVPSSSVVVYTLSTGPSNTKLCFNHQAIANELNSTESEASSLTSSSTSTASIGCALFKELAMTLLNFARVLPHAGVICFFTSHEMEARFVKYLQSTKYYEEINEVKRIFSIYTFMTTHAVKNNQTNFTDRVVSDTQIDIRNHCLSSSLTQSATESNDVLTNMLVEYKRWIYSVATEIDYLNDKSVCTATHNSDCCHDNDKGKITHATRGAFLFTVMGGKLSEGINFADNLARAVLVIGLPFANAQDVELQLHLKHLAQKQLKQGVNTIQTVALSHSMSSYTSTTKSVFTTQAEWNLYNDLCMRVVNQCIGRCIRHINDYAAIVLVDCRYGERIALQRKLATWLQPSLHVTNTFGECFRGLRAFFDNVAKTEADKSVS